MHSARDWKGQSKSNTESKERAWEFAGYCMLAGPVIGSGELTGSVLTYYQPGWMKRVISFD